MAATAGLTVVLRAPLTSSPCGATYLAREGPRRVREGAGRHGYKHSVRLISSEECGRRPIRARAAERPVGCRWAARVAGEECPGCSCLPRCFPRAPLRPLQPAEEHGRSWCRFPPGSHRWLTSASCSGHRPPPESGPPSPAAAET